MNNEFTFHYFICMCLFFSLGKMEHNITLTQLSSEFGSNMDIATSCTPPLGRYPLHSVCGGAPYMLVSNWVFIWGHGKGSTL